MSSHEDRHHAQSLHLYLAIKRTKDGEDARCLRHVIKDEAEDLRILEAKLRILGGTWRIYRTVNARDPKKALVRLMQVLLEHPEKASYVDSQWRTALLQRDCIYGEKRFMLDVDTKDFNSNCEIVLLIGHHIKERYETPNGFHYITEPFDTREVLKLPFVKLLRDGYYFVKMVNPAKPPFEEVEEGVWIEHKP